ncbi:amidase family protein, partial [Streptomyces sp. NPDC001193]
MELHEYTRYDAVGLAGLVARGEVTRAELTDAAQAAIAAVNPRINAVVESWPAEDAPLPGGTPLAGVPFLIKDLAVSMKGKRVESGSRLAAGNVAGEDSFLMRRFRRAGLVTLGRTGTPCHPPPAHRARTRHRRVRPARRRGAPRRTGRE